MARSSGSLWKLALQKFRKDFWGVTSFCVIVFYAFCALFAYVLAPDSTRYANQMHLSIHSQPPGFTVDMLQLPLNNAQDTSIWDWFNGSTPEFEEIPFKNLKQKIYIFWL